MTTLLPPSPREVAIYLLLHSPSSTPLHSKNQSEPSFLVVSSRKHKGKFVLPKGGVEKYDDSLEDAAEREAWEEAGVYPHKQLHLGTLITLQDTQPHSLSPSLIPSSPTFIPSTTYSVQLFTTTTSNNININTNTTKGIMCPDSEWPERKEREERKFVEGFKQLEESICWGRKKDLWKEVIEALKGRLS